MTSTTSIPSKVGLDVGRFARHNAWTIGVWVLLAVLVFWYTTLVPAFGSFEVSSIIRSGLPVAFLAIGQAVIILAGGIDLSLGVMMVLVTVVAGRFMQNVNGTVGLAMAVAIVIGAMVLDGLIGLIISVSKVPDIVVTLATSFILGGLALWVLPGPGGGVPGSLRYIFTGSTAGMGLNPWPSLISFVVPLTIMWFVVRRTRTGLSLYAIGSSSERSYLAGLDVRRSKVVSYALGGAMAAMAGLATSAITGGGDPRFSIGNIATLNSVAAAVLGGIALTGGVGSIVGAAAAGYALSLLSPILTSLQVDPNNAQVIQGSLIILVVMVGGYWQTRRRTQ
ncbi:MAG: ABC transporter permease [Cellulomonas sp.]